MKILLNYKGQAKNYIGIIVFLFLFGFISMVGYLIYSNTMSAFDDAGFLNDESVNKAKAGFDRAMGVWDYLLATSMILLLIGAGITSYTLATPPIFFIISFVLSIFLGLISYFFNYLFYEIVSNSVFSTITVFFPLTILICTNFHWIALASIVIGSITLYAKKDRGQYV